MTAPAHESQRPPEPEEGSRVNHAHCERAQRRLRVLARERNDVLIIGPRQVPGTALRAGESSQFAGSAKGGENRVWLGRSPIGEASAHEPCVSETIGRGQRQATVCSRPAKGHTPS
jgi:hypothetical protein